MGEAVFAGAGVFICAAVIWALSSRDRKQKKKNGIHEKFGKIPKSREWNDQVRNYYDVVSGGSGVDDVTWNDLSMDEVFRRINQCDTSAGEEVLYAKLRKAQMSIEERQLFERRVRTFAGNEKEREAVEWYLYDIGKSGASYYIPSYMDVVEGSSFRYAWMYRGLQILLAAAVILCLFLRNDAAGIVLLSICAVNLAVYIAMKMKYETEISMAGTAVNLIETAKKLVGRKEIELLFPELKKGVNELKGVLRGFRLLRSQMAGGASGDVMGVLLDYILGITLWQITTYHKVMRGLSENVSAYFTVYECVGELDAVICTASFRESLPWYCLPKYTDDRKIAMKELYHPLIKNPVANDLELKKSCLITGSNASGKSTFIKAVSINMILAQALNTCAAGALILPECNVITSMAVRDDLMAGESYFIREIRYLKRILDSLDDNRLTVCAIDEILRGTNTGERIRSSRAILEYLSDKNCIALVATHDRELTDLMGDAYANYHFSEEIGENDIAFSYKLMEGPAASHNAVKLLEFAGFPEEIIAAAQE
ncbi:MAG TPA: hypothetical protein H9817_01590 [Candidatus Mediterraneibacter stercorigallinarum]|uniref:DNA mismatch repair proteins mutS family domain-containing protein n=1 Tax=Candidatus Mediterraneibacter stercorigallinarum TaxID=2838686 RepID=A0A9D2D915_9FIRM|nr:hypothetical protein [Candidatus Mediterraneibacter stercorigallinarum]